MNRNIELKVSRKHFPTEKYALSALHYKDQKSGDEFKVNFKSKQTHDYINIKVMENVRVLNEYICGYTNFQ